ncbi:DinB family protein [Fimbriimonas ginsengisoli]|uniref:DinB-like domain-containing protein n=1 Tax=Fimbriimonas ginsengisoli Gsoil 348 TaxID=661478 RepID=A0A068NTX3_FIMGI|nr:DinB family protein [Fimbriimonas ginsengisoli]AIE86817.1 hypothetical protein OP10G_3449 [Fimbriimonas ginsengisoli Gsoil 348]
MTEAAEALRQIIEGHDFATPAGLLKSIKAETAVAIAPGAPYSIATNVAHAEIWQAAWLCRLRGEPLPKIVMGQDFPEVSAKEWPGVRRAFVDGLVEAHAIASRDPFTHGAKDDVIAIRTLFKIANHGAYHLGQIALLKRLLKQPEFRAPP